MHLSDLFRISLRQVFRQRRRYWGVVLAITVGTAGLMTIFTVGRDVKQTINQDLDLIGGVTIIRCFFDNQLAPVPHWFRPATLAAIRAQPGVARVTSLAFAATRIYQGEQWLEVPVLGVDEYFWEVRNLKAGAGALFGAAALAARQRVVVLGETLAGKLFGPGAVGQTLAAERDLYEVIGVLGGTNDPDLAGKAYFPLTTMEERFRKPIAIDRLYLRCRTWDDVEAVAAALPQVVGRHQGIDFLRVEVAWAALAHTRKVAWWVEVFVYLSLSATLILGGVGITTIMAAAVQARTREIGLKKAFGAEDRDILAQFLTEALLLSLGGAILGGVLGRLCIGLISWRLGHEVAEKVFLGYFALSLLFAVFLGVSAGLYPARQASCMDVARATRYE